MEVVVTSGDVGHAKTQSDRRHQKTNTQLITGRMPFLSPIQQCPSTEWKVIHVNKHLPVTVLLCSHSSASPYMTLYVVTACSAL